MNSSNFPMENNNFHMKNGHVPMKNNNFPMKTTIFPWTTTIFPWKQPFSHENHNVPMKNNNFPIKNQQFSHEKEQFSYISIPYIGTDSPIPTAPLRVAPRLQDATERRAVQDGRREALVAELRKAGPGGGLGGRLRRWRMLSGPMKYSTVYILIV